MPINSKIYAIGWKTPEQRVKRKVYANRENNVSKYPDNYRLEAAG